MESFDEVVYSTDGPFAPAWDFVHAVRRLNFAEAWELLDEDFRTADAQMWAVRQERPWSDALLVANGKAGGQLWRVYVEQQFGDYVRILDWPIDLADRELLGSVAMHRPVGVDLEEVLLADAPESRDFSAGTSMQTFRILLRKRQRWAIAGLAGDLPVPGQPPEIRRYDDSDFG